jgi:hypothetical protein
MPDVLSAPPKNLPDFKELGGLTKRIARSADRLQTSRINPN